MNKKNAIKIGVGMTIVYVLLYLKLLPPTLWMYGSYGFAAALVFLTIIVLGNTTCGGSRRLSLVAAAAGLGTYFCAISYVSGSAQSALLTEAGMGGVSDAIVLWGIALIAEIVGCAIAILTSRHVIVYVALVAGYFITNIVFETMYGPIFPSLMRGLLAKIFPVDVFSFMILSTSISVAGFIAWLVSLYMICKDEEEKRKKEQMEEVSVEQAGA